MNLHEYQSKQLFARYNIPVPEGRPAVSVAEARCLLGGRLVTRQSGAEGLPIHNLLVEQPTGPSDPL
jgi:succinyl-CoA synthetase beta subunit